MPTPHRRPYAVGSRSVLTPGLLVVLLSGLLTACLAPPPLATSDTSPTSTAPGAVGTSSAAPVPTTSTPAPAAATTSPSTTRPVRSAPVGESTPPRPPASSPASSSAPSVARAAAGRPAVTAAYLAFPAQRESEMAAYSLRHYGSAQWRLTPSMIVLHYTAGSTWESARDTFAADAASAGELPGTCAHYVIDRDGTIYALVPVTTRCRHTIGLNDRAIGIEMVQPATADPATADRDILARPAQRDAALALVRWLQATWAIPTSAVIGHAMANADPHFHDLTGARNDHEDWQPADVATFRSML